MKKALFCLALVCVVVGTARAQTGTNMSTFITNGIGLSWSGTGASGALSVKYGAAAGTAVQGNDPRIGNSVPAGPTGAAQCITSGGALSACTAGQLLADIGTTTDNAAMHYRGAWVASTAYVANDVVLQAGLLYEAPAAFTSGSTFSASNWTALTAIVPYASDLAALGSINAIGAGELPLSTGTSGTWSKVAFATGTWTPTFTFATASGDLVVSSATSTATYARMGNIVQVAATWTFTPTYTSAAWVASHAYASAVTVVSGANVYKTEGACTSGTTAPTGTSTAISDGSGGCLWDYVSVAASGIVQIGGLPFGSVANTLNTPLGVTQPISAFTWPNSGSELQVQVQPGRTYANLASLKSGGVGVLASTSYGTFPSGTAVTLSFSGSYLASTTQ